VSSANREKEDLDGGIIASVGLACSHCTAAEVDRQERKGEKPSDHAPVIAEFSEQRANSA